ncbi:GNAT family N-acetyltransferase [Streptomyces sp. st77]|uniref:GNAT family N-acetyltransferase n=1 Tax=Streptomyces sp. st77 TaxID=1828074 RepID=UPI00117DE7DE|nr:GNAT family N-acetyltransferase [Streptomyces sp. st77]
MGRVKPGKTRRRRHDDLPPGIRIRESRPGEGTAFTDLAALAMEGHGDFDDREAMSETVDAGGPFTSRFGAGRLLFLVAEHTPSGRIVGVSSSIPPLSVLGGMERDGADPVVLGATAMAYVKIRALSVADDYRRQGIASALLAKALAVHRDERAFFAYGQFTAGDAALTRFYRRHGFTIHAPGEPVILPGSSRHRDVGASPLLGEQMFSRPI